jgi:hypothetical protein
MNSHLMAHTFWKKYRKKRKNERKNREIVLSIWKMCRHIITVFITWNHDYSHRKLYINTSKKKKYSDLIAPQQWLWKTSHFAITSLKTKIILRVCLLITIKYMMSCDVIFTILIKLIVCANSTYLSRTESPIIIAFRWE